jgi:hypothetical protein
MDVDLAVAGFGPTSARGPASAPSSQSSGVLIQSPSSTRGPLSSSSREVTANGQEAPPPSRTPAEVALDQLDLDPAEVAIAAAFGPAPASWLHAPIYAVKVLTRKRAMIAEVAAAKQRADLSSRDEQASLTRIVQALRARLNPEHPVSAHLKPLEAVDQVATGRGVALEQANRQAETEIAEVDRSVANKEGERAAAQGHATSAREELERIAAEKARAEAKVKRLEIELRAAHEAARIAAGPEAKFAPPEHAKRIRTLEEEVKARGAELAPLVVAFNAALVVHEQRDGDVRRVQREIAQLRTRRVQVEKQQAHQVDLRTASVKEAEQARQKAYADVARTLLALDATLFTETERSIADTLAKDAKAAERTVRLLERARRAEAKEPFVRGLVVLGVFALVFLALFARTVQIFVR